MKLNQTGLFESQTADLGGENELNRTFEFVLVQGVGFRCIAYRDEDGTWREAFNHREIAGAVRVLG
jgi:hypothetical protein